MERSIREAKKQFDWLLSWATPRKKADVAPPELRKQLHQLLVILYGHGDTRDEQDDRERHYDTLCANASEFKGVLLKLRGQLNSHIQECLEAAEPNARAGKTYVFGLGLFTFPVQYDVYSKDGRIRAKPLADTRIPVAKKTPYGDGLTGPLGKDVFDILKFRFFSILEEAGIPVSAIRKCPKCKGFYRATEKKEDPRCRRCFQRDFRSEWGRLRGL